MNPRSTFPYKAGLISLCATTAIIALSIAIYYARLPILEFHGFRQTQTAMTTYWMLREGWHLDYQTPVAGYPWSIPFEFPIYQSLVALIVYLGNFSLDTTGRFVSLAFLFACALPAFAISRRIKLSSETPWVFSILLWSSPLYLFWGRTFMIETSAIFFTFAALPYAIDLLPEHPHWNSTLWFILWITLGMLQKITTALPEMIIIFFMIVISHLKTVGFRLPTLQKTVQVATAFFVPILIAGLWTYYAEVTRAQNILGLEMTSKSLTLWNFGTLQQYLDFGIYKTIIWDRAMVRNAGSILGAFILVISLFFGERHTKIPLLISLALFLLPIEIFINLNLVHDYYQVSSVLFLLGGLSIAIVNLKEKVRNKIPIILAITLIFTTFNLFQYKQTYWRLIDDLQNSSNQAANQILLVSKVLNKYTPQGSAVVILGADWSSEIGYYAERKSFTVPDWRNRPDWPGKSNWKGKYNKILYNPTAYLGNEELGSIVFCTDQDHQFQAKEMIYDQYIAAKPNLFKVSNCYIWLPNVNAIKLPGSNQVILPTDISN
jgi:hypothetical protein